LVIGRKFLESLEGDHALISRVTVSIAFGGSQLILAAATLYHEDYVPTAWQTLLVYWASLLCSMLINLFFAA
jgi:hypothetical protein